jgi:hypothetical protein
MSHDTKSLTSSLVALSLDKIAPTGRNYLPTLLGVYYFATEPPARSALTGGPAWQRGTS